MSDVEDRTRKTKSEGHSGRVRTALLSTVFTSRRDAGQPQRKLTENINVNVAYPQQLQSPMKNLEVKLSLSELELRCKNLFLLWRKH